jgi:hypothetical protein
MLNKDVSEKIASAMKQPKECRMTGASRKRLSRGVNVVEHDEKQQRVPDRDEGDRPGTDRREQLCRAQGGHREADVNAWHDECGEGCRQDGEELDDPAPQTSTAPEYAAEQRSLWPRRQ